MWLYRPLSRAFCRSLRSCQYLDVLDIIWLQHLGSYKWIPYCKRSRCRERPQRLPYAARWRGSQTVGYEQKTGKGYLSLVGKSSITTKQFFLILSLNEKQHISTSKKHRTSFLGSGDARERRVDTPPSFRTVSFFPQMWLMVKSSAILRILPSYLDCFSCPFLHHC